MKQLIFMIVINLAFPGQKTIAAIYRDTVPGRSSQSYYYELIKKSNAQKRASIIMGTAGGALAITGISLGLSELSGLFNPYAKHPNNGSAPEILAIGGAALIVASIPFAIESKKNKRKGRLFINGETSAIAPLLQRISAFTAIGVKINL
ncbi:MAG: hypothetical protein ABJA57_04285 [Ginsengibacter sp.]